ncbi:MAG TPA: ABC transporter ATP-binding protein, partial [bacterium]|nr:ABC transporter ATP-binding protein [bacterium]
MSAVVANNISKKYKLYDRPSDRLKEWFSLPRQTCHRDFWALKDVSFELPKGSALGVIGPNGAGKSTLLKILTGTTVPTEGTYSLIGRVASLLELGAGFHPEFTGRQNLQMNARMLGLTDDEIRERMDEIIEFAELKAFIDQPVRTYSSGMYVRLGFAIASSVRPDVLIVDEALSVGDAYFQRKSIDRIQYFREHGVTILFVSHDLSIVRRFCDQALWLNEGRVQNFSDVHRVSKAYELWERKKEQVSLGIEYQMEQTAAEPELDGSGVTSREQKKKLRVLGSTWGSGEVKITRVEMLNTEGKSGWTFTTGEPITIRYHFYAFKEIPTPVFGLNIHRLDG